MKEMFPAVSSVQKFATKNIARALIRNAPYNPRTITIEGRKKLKASLEEFGSVMPPVWNERTGNLVGGHQRIEQIDAIEGNTDYALTVAVVDLPEDREKALNVILNSPEIGGQFDEVLLKRLLLDVEDSLGFDLRALISHAEADANLQISALTDEPECASDNEDSVAPQTVTLLFISKDDHSVTLQGIEKAKAVFGLAGEKIDAIAVAAICRSFLNS